ncbi:hypothetical protein AAFH96_28725, partial [Polymorphospora sp. 2-325]
HHASVNNPHNSPSPPNVRQGRYLYTPQPERLPTRPPRRTTDRAHLTDPITSVIIGVTVFQETIHLTPLRAIGLALASAAIAVGIYLAGTSTGSGQRR